MGQPRNRLTMFLIALLIAVAAAQNNYTIVNLYGNTACTGTPTATYTSNATAPCTTEKTCGSNGYSQTCSATNGTFADEAANVCGFNLYPSGADCLTSSVSSGLRFVNTACHNVDSTDVSSPDAVPVPHLLRPGSRVFPRLPLRRFLRCLLPAGVRGRHRTGRGLCRRSVNPIKQRLQPSCV